MATIVLRSTNGGPLTNAQLDANFTNLNNDVLARAILNQAPLSQANILPNSSAEFGNFKWTGTATPVFGTSGEGSYWSLPNTASTLSFSQESDFIAFSNVGATLWLQTELDTSGVSSGSIFAKANFYNSSQTLISSGTSLTIANGSTWSWAYGSVVAPANTAYITVSFGYTSAVVTGARIRRIKLAQSLSYYSTEASQYYQQFGNPNNTFMVSDALSTNQAASLGQLNTATSASAILTSIKTVDGSGSGLDADLLDGRDSTTFADVGGSATQEFLVKDGTTATTAASVGQLFRGDVSYSVDTGSAANAYVATFSPAPSALVAGQQFRLDDIKFTNTGASTLAVNSITPVPIYGVAGNQLQGGELVAGYGAIFEVNKSATAVSLIQTTGGSLPVAPATKSNQATNLGQMQAYSPLFSNNAGTALTGTNTVTASITAPFGGVIMAVASMNLGSVDSAAGVASLTVNGSTVESTNSTLTKSFAYTTQITTGQVVSASITGNATSVGYNLYVSILYIPNPGT